MTNQRKLLCGISAFVLSLSFCVHTPEYNSDLLTASVYAEEVKAESYLKKELIENPEDENDKHYVITGVVSERESVEIPAVINDIPVEEIKDGAFRGDKKLKELKISDGVIKIGYSAFAQCENLETVEIPASVKEVSVSSFFKTPWLDNNKEKWIIVGDDVLILYRGEEKAPSIPKNVKYIAKEAFMENKSVEKITFPESIKEIKEYAFSGCKNIKQISLNPGIEKIEQFAFYDCGFVSVTMPRGMSFIGPCAVGYYADLENLYSGLINKFKVIGYKNSVAHYYALEHGIWFEEYVNIYDVSGNCSVGADDIKTMNSHILNAQKQSGSNAENTDINGDGKVNVFDLMRLKQQVINNDETEEK